MGAILQMVRIRPHLVSLKLFRGTAYRGDHPEIEVWSN